MDHEVKQKETDYIKHVNYTELRRNFFKRFSQHFTKTYIADLLLTNILHNKWYLDIYITTDDSHSPTTFSLKLPEDLRNLCKKDKYLQQKIIVNVTRNSKAIKELIQHCNSFGFSVSQEYTDTGLKIKVQQQNPTR